MSLSEIAALMIRLYQKHISPRKGFRCAHRVLHGGASCSEFARQYTLEHGLWAMFPALRLRFRECRMAKETLTANGKAGAASQKKDPTPLWCEMCGGIGDCGFAGAESSCDAPGVDACDCPCG